MDPEIKWNKSRMSLVDLDQIHSERGEQILETYPVGNLGSKMEKIDVC